MSGQSSNFDSSKSDRALEDVREIGREKREIFTDFSWELRLKANGFHALQVIDYKSKSTERIKNLSKNSKSFNEHCLSKVFVFIY